MIKSEAYFTEKNLFEFYSKFGEIEGVESKDSGQLRFINKSSGDWPSFILNKSFDKEYDTSGFYTDITIDNKSKYLILNSEFAIGISDELKKMKYVPIRSWTGMYAIFSEKSNINIRDFEIKRIADSENLENWIQILNETTFKTEKLLREIISPLLSDSRFTLFVGYHKEQPTATALSFFDGNTVGLFMIATAEKQRNKGFGSAITAHAIDFAINRNQFKFVLHATKNGEKIYRKLGFNENCKFYIFAKPN